MDYYEGLIKNTEFLTTAELAEKLKMNVQVITRKVQSGEIQAYKIGKDWRIPETAVFQWLERNSNQSEKQTKVKAAKKTEKAIAPESNDELFVSKANKRKHLLEYILAQFVPNQLYSEEDVNQIISRYENDVVSVRKDFVNEKMLKLVDGNYTRTAAYHLLND